ncbi:hypothetical protein OG205_08955 [Lentzea sp. NBC_00516]|uniref:hypothetical protein n=1 Tax=Lentzea sp. NBC_00516 TaxID=2903582 RepID=UPI002E80E46D|nr:hypothetical protein [Lentzea sp. NBC_00516]WUD27107.1 hypothetical protein OG205_08955 [Lentzea sp. NBC_00516]
MSTLGEIVARPSEVGVYWLYPVIAAVVCRRRPGCASPKAVATAVPATARAR